MNGTPISGALAKRLEERAFHRRERIGPETVDFEWRSGGAVLSQRSTDLTYEEATNRLLVAGQYLGRRLGAARRTAERERLDRIDAQRIALVIGLVVGFVGAALLLA